MKIFSNLCICLSVSVFFAATAQAEYIVNGDFEDTTGWVDAGTIEQGPADWILLYANSTYKQQGTAAIGGSGTSCRTIHSNGKLYQVFDETPAQWTLDFDFAAQDPGAAGDADRVLNLAIADGLDLYILFFIDGDGSVRLHDRAGAGWITPTGMSGIVDFDDDVTTTPLVHHIQFVGHFDLATPTFDVIVTDPEDNVYSATGLTYYSKPIANPGPPTGGGIDRITFSQSSDNARLLIDNVSVVPEPGTLALLLGGLFGLLPYRRK